MKDCIVLVTRTRTQKQYDNLKLCLERCKQYAPDVITIVISDDSKVEYIAKLIEDGYIFKEAKVEGAGELNAYLYLLESTYDRMLLIQDSVFLNQSIDELWKSKEEFLPLWDIGGADLYWRDFQKYDSLIRKIQINKIGLHSYMNNFDREPFGVVFGSMALVTRDFLVKLSKLSNIFEDAYLFNTRDAQSLLERYLFLAMRTITGVKKSYCGNINDHPEAFRNKDPKLNSGMAFTKIW